VHQRYAIFAGVMKLTTVLTAILIQGEKGTFRQISAS